MRVVSIDSPAVRARQNRRHALGQHRLAGAGRAEHQQIVPAGRGDRDRPLGHLLAADVGEVDVVVRQAARTTRRAAAASARSRAAPVKKPTACARLATAITSISSTTAASAALAAGTTRPRKPCLPGRGHRHRQGALRRPRRAVERQLADDGVLLEQLATSICPLPASMPSVIGRSNDAACLGSSAGARLITTRSCGPHEAAS